MKSIFTSLLMAFIIIGSISTFAQTTFTNTEAITTYDNGPGNPFPSTLTVSGLQTYTTKVVVTLHNVNIPNIVCNQVYVQSPTGQVVCLFSRSGNAFQQCSGELIFDQASTNVPPAAYSGNFSAGTYQPSIANAQALPANATDRLDSFNTHDPNGTWSLYENGLIAYSEVGSIDSWSLTITSTDAPLPLSLINFDVHKQNNTAVLTWKTAEEKNTLLFGIERSNDGKNFEQTAAVKAAGNSTEPITYTYTDAYPIAGNNYYRLRMEDKDGSYKYSTIQVADFSLAGVQLYPNPCRDKIMIDGSNLKYATKITLVNITGIKVFSQTLYPGIDNQVLDITHLTAGIYLAEINGQTFRILKQ